jgi:hypothetical protein
MNLARHFFDSRSLTSCRSKMLAFEIAGLKRETWATPE